MARALGRFAAAFVVLAGAGLVLWFARSHASERAPSAIDSVRTTDEVEPAAPVVQALAPTAREVVDTESTSAAPAPEDEESDDEPSDPPTPERPGPGQALLRVQAVALETGAPLAGVELGLFATDDEKDEHEWLSSTQSDPSRGVENDQVLTDSAGHGEFIVQADFAYELGGEGSHGLADEAKQDLGPLHEGEVREVRLALATAWTREWHGRVIDGESGRALVGAEVVAYDRSGDRLDDLVELARGRTNGDGGVVLRLPDWESALVRCELAGYFRGGSRAERDEDAPEAVQDVVLHRTAALVASVVEPDGRPAEGVEVSASVSAWFVVPHWNPEDFSWSQVTDAAGRCEFSELPSLGDVRVSIRRGERVLAWNTTEEFQLQPGERREVQWRIEKGVRLTGRVVDHRGEPLSDVPLRLSAVASSFGAGWGAKLLDRMQPARAIGLVATVVEATTTDEQGRFSIDDVPPGTWLLAPDKTDDLPELVLPFVIRSEDATRNVELTLDRGLFIRGTVLGPDGRPAREVGISCRASDAFFVRPDSSDREGRFVLGPLSAGSYLVQARGSEEPLYAPSEEFAVEAGAAPISLAMRWGGRVRLRPADADGHVFEDGAAMLFHRGEVVREWESLAFFGLEPDAYDAYVWAGENLVGVQRGIRVQPSDDLEVPVSVGPGARVLVASLDGSTDITEREDEWEGLPLGRSLASEFVVPPGTVVVRFFGRDADWVKHLVSTQSHTLAAGDEWRVELPR